MQPRLFLAVPELAGIQRIIVQRALVLDAVDRLVLFVADAVPDDRVDGLQVSWHESGRHLRIVRIGLQDLPRSLPAVFRELHIVVVIGDGQPLVLRAALHDLQHARDGVPRLVEADGPQARDDLHAVVGLRHLQSSVPVADRFADVSKELRRDPVHRVEIADAGPGGDRALDCREPEQVVVLDRLQDRQESLRPSAVRVLADRLPHTFLQPCGDQELCQKLVQLRIA